MTLRQLVWSSSDLNCDKGYTIIHPRFSLEAAVPVCLIIVIILLISRLFYNSPFQKKQMEEGLYMWTMM